MKRYFLLFLILFWLTSCTDKAETTSPTVEDISEAVYASGIVKSKNQHQVFPGVSGVITAILVTEGDTVQQGDPLMKLDNEAARISTENARIAANYASINANSEKLNELQQAINLARSKKQNDSLLFVRQQNLWENKIGTRVELEQRELSYKNSLTAYRSAILRYNDLKKQLAFASKQAQNNLRLSRTLTADYTIKSETAGRVFHILKEEGEMVSPQTPVAVVGDAAEFILELQVDEYDIARVKPGQKVLLNLDSYKGEVFEAKVNRVIPAMNERTRSFTVEATFVTAPPTLYPNLTAEANIIIQYKEKALTIPRDYLVDGTYVLNGNEEKLQVKTGLKDYQKVEIVEGLTKEDVILKPTQ